MTHISFFGAAQEITGSSFLIDSGTEKILIDCGLFQGPRFATKRNHEPFQFDPSGVDALIITHAHIDHSGRTPRLVKNGFAGKIYSTIPTKDLAELMLKDSTGVLAKEAVREKEPMLYEEEDVDRALALWEGKKYHEPIQVGKSTVTLYNSGHILGSAMVLVEMGGKRILFTGDLGNPDNPLLNGFEHVPNVDVLVVESTYGDRVHEDAKEKKLKLERAIERSVMRGGVLMIPAFSLERTQEILLEIADMVHKKQIPSIPIFLDSPLSIQATKIYDRHVQYLSQPYLKEKSFSIFKFPGVHFTLERAESKKINDVPPPKVIIAGSGMSTGGRILHHERRYLSGANNAILFVGYQAPGSLGRRIQDGEGVVTILGEQVPVECHKEVIYGYSAHADENTLFDFIRSHSDTAKEVFAIHGEPKSSLALVQKVRDYLALNARAPKYGETVEI